MSIETPAARYVGQRVARKEDPRLLTGRGEFVADVVLPGMLECAFVRSPYARARITGFDLEAARAVPGVRAIYTAADLMRAPVPAIKLAPGYGAGVGPEVINPLAHEWACFAGDPVAIVVADNRYIAEDAAGLVQVDYESEDAVVTIADARGGPAVHRGLDNNLGASAASPDDPGFERIFADAAHVVTGKIIHQRQVHCPMETCGVVASPGAGELTVYMASQGPHWAARQIAQQLGLPDDAVRVISKDVGGAFGLKSVPSRDQMAAILAAILLQRPVKWIEDRLENLTAGLQAREQEITVRLALDADARLLALDVDFACNLGAYPSFVDCNGLAMMVFPALYRFGAYRYKAAAYYSNTCGLAPYRGPWMIETLARETMLDLAARQIGIDPIELRRRNLIDIKDQPHTMLTGLVVDRVTPRETLELALERLGLADFRAEQARARAEGRYLGLGLAAYLEPTAMSFDGPMVAEAASVRIEPSGRVTAVLTTHSQGQGTATTMAQIVADQLGVDIDDVTVQQEDSSRGGYGFGAGGSRQGVIGGGAARKAAGRVADKVRAIAAHLLNATPEDIRIEGGEIRVAGVDEVSTTVARIAETAYFNPDRLPPDMDMGLEAEFRYRPPPITFANAAHACVVEVDIDTGKVKVLRWIAAEDCGVLINPAVVEGQIAGGVAQAIGGVLYEDAPYDEYGNPRAATFKDYLLPQALDMPLIEFEHLITPSASEGGYKGVGEGGAIIGPPTLVNAINDALAPLGVFCLELPLTPDRLVMAIAAAS